MTAISLMMFFRNQSNTELDQNNVCRFGGGCCCGHNRGLVLGLNSFLLKSYDHTHYLEILSRLDQSVDLRNFEANRLPVVDKSQSEIPVPSDHTQQLKNGTNTCM